MQTSPRTSPFRAGALCIISGKMLGGDAIRAITRGVGVTAAVPIAAHTGAVKKVRATGGVKKEAKSARTSRRKANSNDRS